MNSQTYEFMYTCIHICSITMIMYISVCISHVKPMQHTISCTLSCTSPLHSPHMMHRWVSQPNLMSTSGLSKIMFLPHKSSKQTHMNSVWRESDFLLLFYFFYIISIIIRIYVFAFYYYYYYHFMLLICLWFVWFFIVIYIFKLS